MTTPPSNFDPTPEGPDAGRDPFAPQPGLGQTPQPGPGQQGYGQPFQPGYSQSQPGQRGAPVGAYGQTQFAQPTTNRGAGKWIAAIVALALVLGVGGAVAFAAQRVLGGGVHPEERTPASAIMFAKVDLDPSAGQKLDAIRFLRKFPELRDTVSENGDLKEQLWKSVSKEEKDLAGIDYAKDIKPWLGDRAAVAVLAGAPGEDPIGVGLVQVKDEEKAKVGIQKLIDADTSSAKDQAFAVSEGYAVISDTRPVVDKFIADAQSSSLADNADFVADAEKLGDTGVSAGWVNLERFGDLLKSQTGTSGLTPSQADAVAKNIKGRYAYALRFDGADVELAVKGSGFANDVKLDSPVATGIGKLPASTLGAFSLTNGDQYAKKGYNALVESLISVSPDAKTQIDERASKAGLSLPDDLAVLLGSDLSVALDSEGLSNSGGRVGARITTDPQRFTTVLKKVLTAAGQSSDLAANGLFTQPFTGGIAVANSAQQAEALSKDGTLGDTEQFKRALPDLNGAVTAMFLDVDGIASKLTIEDAKTRDSLAAIDSVGMTASTDGNGNFDMRLRVVTK